MPFYKTTKFNRQKPLGEYIVDFYCHKHRLVIEVDGDTHYVEDAQRKNQIRTAFLESKGLRVVRFTNQDVVNNTEGVMFQLEQIIEGKAYGSIIFHKLFNTTKFLQMNLAENNLVINLSNSLISLKKKELLNQLFKVSFAKN